MLVLLVQHAMMLPNPVESPANAVSPNAIMIGESSTLLDLGNFSNYVLLRILYYSY